MRIVVPFIFFMYPAMIFAHQISLNGVVKSTEGDNLLLANIFVAPDRLTITSGKEGKFASAYLPVKKLEFLQAHSFFSLLSPSSI